MRHAAPLPSETERSRQEVATKRRVHRLVRELIGREELRNASATKSEPVAIFVGLAGLNKVILVDLVAWPMVVEEDDGDRLAEPWQATFERACHFWAVYVEEDTAPFFTSIDAEFRRNSAAEEHDDFDPQGVVRRDLGVSDTGTIAVRLGYKRFSIPDGFDAIRITFSRQSSSNGLRQWSRIFTRYGRLPFGFAGTVVVPAPIITRRDYVIADVFVDDRLTAGAYSLDETRSRQPIFAALAVRFPHLRASAEQAPIGWSRFWRSMTPEPVIGLGVPTANRAKFIGESLLMGGSWRVVGDRVHFVIGRVRTREPFAKPGITVPSRLASKVPLEDLRELGTGWKTVAAISVDLARTW